MLRDGWQEHINKALIRPLLLVDEAQEMRPEVLSELRLLAAARLDSRLLLTVVLCGDERLPGKLRAPELVPLAGRIRVRLLLDSLAPDELARHVEHLLQEAGNPTLMTVELIRVMAEHAAGNLRTLMNLASELLELAIDQDLKQLDEPHYLELVGQQAASLSLPARSGKRR